MKTNDPGEAVKRVPTGHAKHFGGEGGPEDKPAAMPKEDAHANTMYINTRPIPTRNRLPFKDHVDALKRTPNMHFKRAR